MNFNTLKTLTLSLSLLYAPLTCANITTDINNQNQLNNKKVISQNFTQQQIKEEPILDLSDKAIMAVLKKDKESKASSFFGRIKMRLDEKCRKEEYYYAIMYLKDIFCESIEGEKGITDRYLAPKPKCIKIGLKAAIARSGRDNMAMFVRFSNLELLYISEKLSNQFKNNRQIIASNMLRKWMVENPKKIVIS